MMFEAQCVPGIEGHPAMKLAELKRILTVEKVAAVVTIIGFPLVLVSLIFAITLDEHQLKIARSQNNIALNQMLYGDPRNIAIIEAIENKKAIVKTPSGDGQFSSAQLDKYLGDLQTVYDVYKEGLLSEDELCGSFSVYIQEAEANQEVKDYLKANSKYFSGLPKLFAVVDNSTKPDCRAGT